MYVTKLCRCELHKCMYDAKTGELLPVHKNFCKYKGKYYITFDTSGCKWIPIRALKKNR